jgi:hypothetical protein
MMAWLGAPSQQHVTCASRRRLVRLAAVSSKGTIGLRMNAAADDVAVTRALGQTVGLQISPGLT